MKKETQKQLAYNFQKLHKKDKMLILPNVWNGGSSVVFEKQGFPAIATTSAGIAYSMGYPDGETIKIDDLTYITRQIVDRVNIPLSVDIERGYGNSISEITKSVKKIIEAGAVGLNIEDGYPGKNQHLEDLDFQVQKIDAICTLKKELDIPFVINARTCACWLKIKDDNKTCLDEAILRSKAFVKAGADCVFIPGALDKNSIQRLVNEINAPVNIIANPLFNDLAEMQKTGVKRLSIGSGAVRTVFSNLIDIAQILKTKQSIQPMLDNNFSYNEANEYFKQ